MQIQVSIIKKTQQNAKDVRLNALIFLSSSTQPSNYASKFFPGVPFNNSLPQSHILANVDKTKLFIPAKVTVISVIY